MQKAFGTCYCVHQEIFFVFTRAPRFPPPSSQKVQFHFLTYLKKEPYRWPHYSIPHTKTDLYIQRPDPSRHVPPRLVSARVCAVTRWVRSRIRRYTSVPSRLFRHSNNIVSSDTSTSRGTLGDEKTNTTHEDTRQRF